MKNTNKKILSVIALILAAAILLCLAGCAHTNDGGDIVVLFTNDIHCGVDDNIGYAGLAAYKKSVEKRTPYVTLVDCGDHLQGTYLGLVSGGEIITDIMNAVGYDLAIFGNHEFDFGLDRLQAITEKSNARYLCCNLVYTGSGKSALTNYKPYEIVSYGKTKVAYIGVSTPVTLKTSTPIYFMKDGEYIYSFFGGNDGRDFYDVVQKNIDECRAAGADYVVLLTHLGTENDVRPYSSTELIENTRGADVVLDAHSHYEIPCDVIRNADGKDVLVSQTGTKLAKIGQLVITDDGFISVGYIDNYPEKDAEIAAFTASAEEKYGAELVKADIKDSYYNMLEKIKPHMHLIENARKAIAANGMEPIDVPIRGGTDGARLSFEGLPCPNLGTGGFNFHGCFECITVERMDKSVAVIKDIIRLYAQQ